MNIHPQFLTLNQVLKERLFRIPQYQRGYSWNHKQREDLFEDIKKLKGAKPDEAHFMATVVGLRRDKRDILTTEHQVIEVVDGQQRLTTLVLLLKAIALALREDDATEAAVRKEIESLLVKSDETSLVLLQTNHDTSQHFTTYLRSGTHREPALAATLADRALLNAMVECESFVAEWKSKGTLLSLVMIVKNRLSFIFHELADESSVYTVFEVLNSRGLDVSSFDRLKSIIMGIAFDAKTGNEKETIAELHRLWGEIYRCIGLRQGLNTEALRFTATLWSKEQPNRSLSEEDSVEVLRAAALVKPKAVIDVSEKILKVVQAVDKLWGDQRLKAVTEISQARLLATAIHLRTDLEESQRIKLLSAWEKITFRIYGMFKRDARTKVGDYVRLAWLTIQKNLHTPQILSQIAKIGSEYSIDNAVKELANVNCYDEWQAELRYFFFRYEESLAVLKGQNFSNEQWSRIWQATASDSIEHVQPQSKGSATRSDTGIFVHRLGNLVLLPPRLNSKLRAKDPVDKKDAYTATGLLIAQDVATRIPTWDRTAIEKREAELLAWALKEWAD